MERPDGRLHLARELLEDRVLIFHLRDEACRLEKPLAVVVAGDSDGLPLRQRGDPGRRRVVGQRVVDVIDQPVVFGVEDLVDRGQRDVLVAAPVTTGEVRVEHLVVVGVRRLRREVG